MQEPTNHVVWRRGSCDSAGEAARRLVFRSLACMSKSLQTDAELQIVMVLCLSESVSGEQVEAVHEYMNV